jgi:hypothetical protein
MNRRSRVATLVVAVSLFAGCHSGGNGGGDGGGGGKPDGGAGGTGTPDLSVVVQDMSVSTGSYPDLAGAPPPCKMTCASLGANCGLQGDGCGGMMDCGSCTLPQTCGGGGTPSVCGGTAGCIKRTCQQANAGCGPAADGCGGILDCGSCNNPGESCGGGGVPSQCGKSIGTIADGGGNLCTPIDCATQGIHCGPAGDGCGHMLDCGGCNNPGESCGGGGAAGVCGKPPCTPITSCSQVGANCGPIGDGCGGKLDCGGCNSPAICGGGGVPSVCGGGGADGGVPCTNLCLKQMPCANGATTTISGTVLAPTNKALGYGDPDPLYNALVYIPNGKVDAFTPGVSCQQCNAQASGSPLVSAITGPDGKFVLKNAPVGANIPLVVQLGRWRRQVLIPNVNACVDNPLSGDYTRLPRNKSEGDIPHIAIVTGGSDPIECVLPKIGVDAAEFTDATGNGRIHIFHGNGSTVANAAAESQLISSEQTLEQYDMVVYDCQGNPNDRTANQQNMLNYTTHGGRLYASHYSYDWLYNLNPFSTTAQWQVDQAYPANLTGYVDTSFQKGKDFSTWLTIVKAATTPGQIPVQQVRHDANGVNNPPAQQWMYADPAVSANTPLQFTFNTPVNALPASQCGRVMFSDFHVNTGGTGGGTFPGSCNGAAPMTPQEKVLEFMLFDLSSCIAPDQPPPPPTCKPRTCLDQKISCGPAGDGCGKLLDCGSCVLPDTCGGGGTPGVCGHVCKPRTCQDQMISCGPAGDGCGHPLDCGPCTPPDTCGGGGMPGVCGHAVGCMPLTCAQQGLSCGPAGDGCGNKLDCGPCTPPQTCGGGGKPGVCGSPMCTPRTCQQLGYDCGPADDGCGNLIDCGKCNLPATCGGGGIAGHCGTGVG